MKAWLLDDFKGLDALRLAETADPQPLAGEVVLELEYAALNPADRYLAENQYPAKPPLPHILGRDGVGIVTALGAGVTQFQVGQRLQILRGETGVSRAGTFAQRVAVAADSLVPPPAGWSAQESCSSLVYLTAYQALTMWEHLPAGSTILITGASGGVGVASLQLAKSMGHQVIALSRSAEKRGKLLDLGAAMAIDPNEANWPKRLKESLGAKRVDLLIDNIGGKELSHAIETLGNNGRISVVGRLAGPVPEFNTATMFFRRLRMGGVHVGSYQPAEARHAWDALVAMLRYSNARPIVDRIFPFEQLRPAFEHLASGPMGKVLLAIRPS
jgi:NADPH2:quinone reductase